MNFKLMSKEGSALSIAHRLNNEEGSSCVAYIEDEECKCIADNIVPKAPTPIELDIKQDDIVLFDASGAGESAEVLKKNGVTVIGAGALNDKLEQDRSYGIECMKSHNIRVPDSWEFNSFDEVEDFIRARPERYVFKPSGNPRGEESKGLLAMTYVSTSPENLISMLPYLKRECEKRHMDSFILQRVVEGGIEMSTEAWFNGRNFILPLNSTFEEKKFMEGGRGPNTGCMGSVQWNWSPEISLKLYELLFKDLEDELVEAGYLGPLDINAIWTPSGPYGLEFTPRFGFDAIQGFLRNLEIPPGKFFTELRGLDRIPARDSSIAMAVAISTPPYPDEPPKVPRVPVLGITPSDLLDTVYQYDLMYDTEIGMFSTSGAYNWVCSITDHDTSFDRLCKRIYEKVESVEVADKQYRMDIGERFPGDLRKVSRWIARL